jgi:hypothetical protein
MSPSMLAAPMVPRQTRSSAEAGATWTAAAATTVTARIPVFVRIVIKTPLRMCG